MLVTVVAALPGTWKVMKNAPFCGAVSWAKTDTALHSEEHVSGGDQTLPNRSKHSVFLSCSHPNNSPSTAILQNTKNATEFRICPLGLRERARLITVRLVTGVNTREGAPGSVFRVPSRDHLIVNPSVSVLESDRERGARFPTEVLFDQRIVAIPSAHTLRGVEVMRAR